MKERLQEILKIALTYGVTDIHFDILKNEQEKISIEMRVSGKMKQVIPKKDDIRLFRYLMYRANLDVSDAFSPQTGSFKETVGKEIISLRFAIVSSYHVVSGVLRILNNHSGLCVSSLSDDAETLNYLMHVTTHDNGLFLFSGPTGSGKTTTLYTLLNETEGKKIFSLEDPVEVVNEKYVQIQINEKQHMSYADGIKQLMRHDPDIIMIGEIRDESAAKMAVRCAFTGHLVVSTIHSFSCLTTLLRMEDLGVDQYQLKDVLKGISSQRLIERRDGRKYGIYEFLNAEQIASYFEKGVMPNDFEPIEEKIRKAYDAGKITKEQAKVYIAERRL